MLTENWFGDGNDQSGQSLLILARSLAIAVEFIIRLEFDSKDSESENKVQLRLQMEHFKSAKLLFVKSFLL